MLDFVAEEMFGPRRNHISHRSQRSTIVLFLAFFAAVLANLAAKSFLSERRRAKAPFFFVPGAARLKPCPDTNPVGYGSQRDTNAVRTRILVTYNLDRTRILIG